MKKIVVLGQDNNIRVTRWIEFLLKEGWEVALIYSSRKNETFRHPSFSSYNMGLNFIKRSKNSKIIQNHNSEKFSWTDVSKKTNLNDLKSDMNSLTLSLIYGFKIYHLIKRIRPDAILVQGSGSIMSTFGYLLRSKFSIKKPTPIFFVIWGRSIRTKIFFWIEKYVLQSSTKIMANKTLKEIYVKHYGISANKFIINDWGINLKRNYPATDEEISKIVEKYGISNSNTILFHNRLFTPQYNIEDFFDIIPQCVNFIPNLKLLLVRGFDENTSYIDFILKKFEDKDLTKYIHYIPQKIPYDEMRILYGLSFTVVSPIEHDGFCASIMEAMACGGIPILYAIESYTEKMENNINALFAPIGDTDAFAKNIVFLYQNHELRDRIIRNNIDLVKKIGDENINFGKIAYEMEKYIKN